MNPVYDIAPNPAGNGWMVIDTTTGDVARVGDREMSSLSIEDADDLADLLNHLERIKRAKMH
ncbi:hypothetical protein D3867_15200 (plasmid) [Azospirillum argentinense]|uniref:Uncharacterized protein n=1 Tax=Azospirillum brasilense TaxID=192 RepID=A0A4D8Q7E6_AZOBR|nr:hypothetical protein D3867_15200 [Azospirillum argentinense]